MDPDLYVYAFWQTGGIMEGDDRIDMGHWCFIYLFIYFSIIYFLTVNYIDIIYLTNHY